MVRQRSPFHPRVNRKKKNRQKSGNTKQVPPAIRNWLKYFLRGRRQEVEIGNTAKHLSIFRQLDEFQAPVPIEVRPDRVNHQFVVKEHVSQRTTDQRE